MGCDIHLHVEVKIDGKWEHWSCPDVNRDYELFGWLADVRGDDPVAPQKGIPDDATTLTKLHCEDWGVDGHSHSWLGTGEVAEVARRYEARGQQSSFERDTGIGYVPGYRKWSEEPDPAEDGPMATKIEDARIVFWFDN